MAAYLVIFGQDIAGPGAERGIGRGAAERQARACVFLGKLNQHQQYQDRQSSTITTVKRPIKKPIVSF